jgi:hypothetical protein
MPDFKKQNGKKKTVCKRKEERYAGGERKGVY